MADPYYPPKYSGDVSKLDVMGVLMYSSVLAACYEGAKSEYLHSFASMFRLQDIFLVPFVVAILEYCTQVANEYKTAPNHRRRFARLVRRARTCIPAAIQMLRETPIPAQPRNARRFIAQLVQACTDYGVVLGICPSASADENAFVPPKPEMFAVPFRTCAPRSCLCHGRKPAHKMRECMGCHVVFYCGKQCQTQYVPSL